MADMTEQSLDPTIQDLEWQIENIENGNNPPELRSDYLLSIVVIKLDHILREIRGAPAPAGSAWPEGPPD